MKKIIAILLITTLLIILASCERKEGNFTSSQISGEDSSFVSSSSESGSGADVSDQSDVAEESNTSEESDVQTNDEPSSYESLLLIEGYDFARAASGYSIVYTKVNPIAANECFTNTVLGITAVYDGSVTRFFDAVNGKYYTAVQGKYLLPCYYVWGTESMDLVLWEPEDAFCGEAFLYGNPCDFEEPPAGMPIEITLIRGVDENGDDIVTISYEEHPIHGSHLTEIAFFSKSEAKIYVYGGFYVCGIAAGQVPCREYSAAKPIWEDYFEDDMEDVEIDFDRFGKFGVASNEKVIIPFEYDWIATSQNSDGNIGVYLAVKDGRCYYLSSDGTNLTPEGFDCGSQPFGDRAWVFENGQAYIIEFS